jgi:hypothetical protein
MKLRYQLAGAAALVAALPAFSQVKINDALTVTGWATGSYQYTQPSPGSGTDSLNVDNALLEAIVTPAKKVTGTISVLYHPSSEGGVSPGGSEATLLDAYVAYDCGGGVTVTAGKFLSYLGYESFYSIDDNMITLANQSLLAPIPGYHEGIKLDYAPDKTDTLGFSVADSEYQKPGYDATEGLGSLKHQAGFEAYYQNTAINNLTIWIGAGYETPVNPGVDTNGVTEEIGPKGVVEQFGHQTTVADVWVSYVLDKNNDTVAAEEIYKEGGYLNQGSDWLLYYQQNFTGKVSSWFCFSGEDVASGEEYVKYSIAPNYAYNNNLSVRAQFSYTAFSKTAAPDALFGGAKDEKYYGVEMLFKF